MNQPVEQHRGHPKQIIPGPFGPHAGKMQCLLCKKFVKWVPREMIKKPVVF